MKKYGKRIAAFALSLVVALGSVCYKPPKAEAFVLEGSAILSAALSTYLSATGFNFDYRADNLNDATNAAIWAEMQKLAKEFDASYDQINDEMTMVLRSGFEVLSNGVVKISAAAADVLGRFSDWLIAKFGLNDVSNAGSSIALVPRLWSLELPGSDLYWNTEVRPYYAFFTALGSGDEKIYVMFASEAPLTTHSVTMKTGLVKRYIMNRTDEDIDGVSYIWSNGNWTVENRYLALHPDWGWRIEEIFASSYDVCDTYDNSVYFPATHDLNVPDYSNPWLSASLSESYKSIPNLSEKESLYIDTGLTYEDEDSFVDAVMNGLASGTLSPSYSIETDTESWIYNGVSLPALPDGVKDYQFITYFPDYNAAYLYVADSSFYVDSAGKLRSRDDTFDLFIYDPNGIAGEACSDWTLSASNISSSVLGGTVDWANEDIADERTGLVYIQGADITIPGSGAGSDVGEGEGSGSITVPDVGEDTEDEQAGILSWTKKIWQSIVDLPKSIADAIANIFVPSEEYIAVLPETVAATFDERTGFLTYPVSVLYDFADKLSRGQSDFILRWPTVIEPYSGGQLMAAGQFNVSKYVRDNDFASDVYTIYQWVMGGYLTFLFLGLCRRKYNSVIGDRLGG